MSPTSLVVSNRIAQFMARFEPQADGSFLYYHPDRRTGGLSCSAVERDELVLAFAEGVQRSARGMMFWVIGAGLVLGVMEAAGWAVMSRWGEVAVLLMPLPFTLWRWREASAQPMLLLGGRLARTPPRTAVGAFWQRAAALPNGLLLAMVLLSVLLGYQLAVQRNWHDTGWLVVAVDLLLVGVALYARRRSGA